MPILKNAKKALRSSKRKAVINLIVKSKMKSSLKKTKLKPSVANLNNAYSAVDKACKKNLIHKNKAARLKRQISKICNQAK